jgi:hypothetical protein
MSIAACSNKIGPEVYEVGKTGAAIVTTPSTQGITSVSPDNQTVCTEPRPSASVEFANAATANANANVNQTGDKANVVTAAIATSLAEAAKVGTTLEFERVEFLSHGLFGLCQVLTSPAGSQMTADQVSALVTAIVERSSSLPEEVVPTATE